MPTPDDKPTTTKNRSTEGDPEQGPGDSTAKKRDSSTDEPSIATGPKPSDRPLNPNQATETNDEAMVRQQGQKQDIIEQENKNKGRLPTLDPDAKPSERKDVREKLLSVFTRITGYDDKDVDGVNERTRTLTTTNGGKYQLTGRGAVRKLQGPNYPNWEPEA